jgi:hypothetical protein
LVAALKLDAAGNTLRADGRLATRGTGSNDAWAVQLDAKTLERLAPLYKLMQPAGADAALAGQLSASGNVTGRWPASARRASSKQTLCAWAAQRSSARKAAGRLAAAAMHRSTCS